METLLFTNYYQWSKDLSQNEKSDPAGSECTSIYSIEHKQPNQWFSYVLPLIIYDFVFLKKKYV